MDANIRLQNTHIFKPVTSNLSQKFYVEMEEVPPKYASIFDEEMNMGNDNVISVTQMIIYHLS